MPVRLHYEYKKLKVDKAVYDAFYKEARLWWSRNVMAWAEAVLEGIHVDTGMSASSIAPLMDAVGGVGTGRIIIGRRAPRKGVTTIDGKYHKDLYKSPELGAEFGQHAFVYELGSVRKPLMTFSYSIQVFQWAYWEDQWQTNVDAVAAFTDSASKLADMSAVFRTAVIR
jgi:hypothetical protein